MKAKDEVPVHCRNCRNSSDFIENSCYCKALKRRVCACNIHGRLCEKFIKR